MERWVEIAFDCLPLRAVPRLDIPLDASPNYRARCERVKAAIDTHGSHNSYYLYNARCVYRLVNSTEIGTLEFAFEGTVLTDAQDRKSQSCFLDVELTGETCDWLNAPVTQWFAETVVHSVKAEFDRYIQAGDLAQTCQRLEQLEDASDAAGGFMGMYL